MQDSQMGLIFGSAMGLILIKMFNKMLKEYNFWIRIQIFLWNWGKGGKMQLQRGAVVSM